MISTDKVTYKNRTQYPSNSSMKYRPSWFPLYWFASHLASKGHNCIHRLVLKKFELTVFRCRNPSELCCGFVFWIGSILYVILKWNGIDFKVPEAKRFMGQDVHQDGFKQSNSLEYQSATVSVSWRVLSTWWSISKTGLRLSNATF